MCTNDLYSCYPFFLLHFPASGQSLHPPSPSQGWCRCLCTDHPTPATAHKISTMTTISCHISFLVQQKVCRPAPLPQAARKIEKIKEFYANALHKNCILYINRRLKSRLSIAVVAVSFPCRCRNSYSRYRNYIFCIYLNNFGSYLSEKKRGACCAARQVLYVFYQFSLY